MNFTLNLRKLVSLLAVCMCAFAVKAQTDQLDNLKEFDQRNGLPNFFSKLKAGKQVTVAYFGGSITAAKDGWRDQSVSWLQSQYPKAMVKQINAAVGGTGSDLGVFRLKNDVLTYRPDLVFVEFAVNDGSLDPARIHETMEGIVRQIWRADPLTDICFVYTLSGNMVPKITEGKLWPSMLAMEHIANHYDIPSVKFAPEVVQQIKTGKVIFQGKPEENTDKIVFTTDNVHPLPKTGQRIYAEILVKNLRVMADHARTVAHKLGKPYTRENWEDAEMISLRDIVKAGSWQELTQQDSVARMLRNRFPVLYKSVVPGASLKLKFNGRLAGIYDVVGPGCGQYVVTVDGAGKQSYPRFDKYSSTYRSFYFTLPLMNPGLHEVEWKVSDQAPDKTAVMQQVANQGNLRKFEENACYAGWVLLLGTQIK
ncbi:SGNH/GDSL hydrolase family protein [Pedobacter sp. MC2016-14]|uniref:SGNH/GDSL hydrolase family protein n=1 Tax=Pedobacter sp. MC2016-14 TaxID=2897327 RepID=UPI001E40023C|nr:SGNH/GDSL hydrolase family protein [Pedobacter sp. MC2016-14]MCD0488971.1 SGNH/GDSL hydrolase family protein [Pedobacter sp. MC2016-14]